MTEPAEELFGWDQVADALGVSVRTVKRWAHIRGYRTMPVYRFMGRIRANRSELLKWRTDQHRLVSARGFVVKRNSRPKTAA